MIRSIWKEFLAKLPVHFGNSVTVRTAKSKISSKCVLHFLGYSKLKSYIIKTQNYKINDFLLLFVSIVIDSNKFSGLIVKNWNIWLQTWNTKWLGRKIKQLIRKKKLFSKNFKIFFPFFSYYFFPFFRQGSARSSLVFKKNLIEKLHLKWLLGADLKILFTFSNPALKSAVQWVHSNSIFLVKKLPVWRILTLAISDILVIRFHADVVFGLVKN